MKVKKQLSFYILIAVVFCVLYILFAIKPLGKEFLFTPKWKINITNPQIEEKTENSQTHYFKLGQSAGYFTDDGKIINYFTFPFKVAISENFYTSYNSNNIKSDVFNSEGKKVFSLVESGFPMIIEDRFYVFLPGGSAFSTFDSNGKKIWEFDSTCPITSFNSTKDGILAGYANGSLIHFSNEGHIIQNFVPGGSDYPIILGAALSNDSIYTASISGRNKQRFTLAKKENAQTKIIFHEYFQKDANVQQIVKFTKDDKLCFYTSKEFAGILNIQQKKSIHIPISGNPVSLKESNDNFVLLTKQNKKYRIYIIEKFSKLTGKFEFEANSAFIETCGNNLYVGKNDSISKIEITKE